MPASKLLTLQPNHIKDSSLSTTSATYMNGQQNGGTKIVLVTSEPMDIENNRNGTVAVAALGQPSNGNNGTDEELTSLTWLHDKNLIKGINNISCPPNIKHMNNNNHLKIVNDSTTMKSQTSLSSPGKASSSGTVTPTSDLIDDSGVSEDNTSSLNSSSEHGSIYSRSKALVSVAREIENDDDGDNNNSITVNNKNRGNLTQHHHHLNLNHNQPPPASSIIHLSPGGSTVVDTNGSISTANAINASNPIITAKSNVDVNGFKIIKTTANAQHSTTATATTAHTHFHKRYIKQMYASNGCATDATVSVVVTTASAPTSITNSMNSSTPNSSPNARSPTIYSIPVKTTEYSPQKYEHETVIVENEYPHATITLANNTNHHIYHCNEIDRHSDEYITPISSPRLQHQPAAPQKLSNPINLIAHSPPTVTISQPSNSVPVPSVSPSSASNQTKSANGVPYDPFIHTNNKPPLSFSSLIFLAIEDAKEKALPVKEIYAWIVKHYPYFKTAPTGWKNSVRHNLSLNKCFQKVEKAPNMGKGSLWRVEQQYKQNLIIALTRSSYHPNTSAMEKATASLKNPSRSPDSPTPSNKRPLDEVLFPRLSKYMAHMQNGNSVKSTVSINGTTDIIVNSLPEKEYQIHNGKGDLYHGNGDGVIVTTIPASYSNHGMHSTRDGDIDAIETQRNVERIARDWGVDSIDDVNAATAMLALKHGPKVFTETFQAGTPIITSVPSEDHTYSAGGATKRPTTNGSGLTTVINIGPPEINESNAHFNGTNNSQVSSTIQTVKPIQVQNHTNHVMNTINEVVDNRHSDTISTSSDAAYESSEDSQNDITAEELEARRHQEGVDAFLSFATEVSSMSSPLKRPPSADYVENVPMYKATNNNHIFANNNRNNYYYYDSSSSPSTGQQHYSYLSSPSPPKKSRTRTLRTKLKKKTWIR